MTRMPGIAYERTPYGWCCDFRYDNKYSSITWQEYIEKMEEWLNKRSVNYSVVHYKSIVRVHVFFSALKKMGFKEAVELYWYSTYELKQTNKLLEHPWTRDDVERHVRQYFIHNGLPVD